MNLTLCTIKSTRCLDMKRRGCKMIFGKRCPTATAKAYVSKSFSWYKETISLSTRIIQLELNIKNRHIYALKQYQSMGRNPKFIKPELLTLRYSDRLQYVDDITTR